MRPAFKVWLLALSASLAGAGWGAGPEVSRGAVAADLDEVYQKPDSEKTWGELLDTFVGFGGYTKSYALIVGINHYSGGYKSLPTGNDPLRMRDFLLEEAGFDYVHVLTNRKATYERIRNLMVDVFPTLLDRNDRFLFYWSGHGDQRPNALGGNVGYLPLADSAPGRYATMVSMGDIQRWDALLRSEQALFLLDACFSGLAGSVSQSINRNLKIEELARPAHHLITAGTENEQTIAGDRWGGSIFTDSVIHAIRGDADMESSFPRDGVVSLHELVEFVATRVAIERRAAGWTRSITPTIRDLRGGAGQFFFLTSERKVTSTRRDRSEQLGGFRHGRPIMLKGDAAEEVLRPAQLDGRVWHGIRESRDPADFEIFIAEYPESPFVPYAESRLASLKASKFAAPPPGMKPPTAMRATPQISKVAKPAKEPLDAPGALSAEENLVTPSAEDAGDSEQRIAALKNLIEANKDEVGRALLRFWRQHHLLRYDRAEILSWKPLRVEGDAYVIQVEFYLERTVGKQYSEWETKNFLVRRSDYGIEFLAFAAERG